MPLAAPSSECQEPTIQEPTTEVAELLEKGRLSHRNNQLLQAAECYRQTLELKPNSQAALLGLSLIARQSRQYDAALRMAEATLSCSMPQSPDAALAWAHHGHCLFALRRIGEAEGAFRKALNIAAGPMQIGPEAVSQVALRAAEHKPQATQVHEKQREERPQPDSCAEDQRRPEVENLAVAKLASIEGHVGLGELLSVSNRASEAILHFRQAIVLAPLLATAHYGLGCAMAQRDDFAGALASFDVAARLAPTSHLAFFALAFSHARLGQTSLAVAAYRKCLERRPKFASAWLNLGVALIADGREPLAGHYYRQAISVLPTPEESDDAAIQTHISAHLNLGHLERGRRNFESADAEYKFALKFARSENVRTAQRRSEIFVAFAYLHLDQGNLEAARQSLDQSEEADFRSLQVSQGKQNDGKTYSPNPEIPNARGIVLLAQQSANCFVTAQTGELVREGNFLSDIEKAILAFEKAESLGHKTAASNRGNALLRLGRCSEALAAHAAAFERDPHHPGVRYNLALTQLRLGDFARGWENYEVRWKFREVHPRPRRFAQPRWKGEALVGESLVGEALATAEGSAQSPKVLVYSEQGLGDTIQFVRYLSPVAERLMGPLSLTQPAEPSEGAIERAMILFEVQPSLARLLAPYLDALQAMFHGLRTRLICHGEALPLFTHHCPLLSMPAIFNTNLDSVPQGQICVQTDGSRTDRRAGYLQADESLVSKRANEIELDLSLHASSFPESNAFAPILRIGIAWAGNPKYRADYERSIHLNTLIPLLGMPEFAWFSLQKGEAASQILELPSDLRPHDSSSADRDLADTAALIQNLDLVITTDTVIAHLAGALGKPLWLLLPWQSDWRWMQDLPDSPWYPTARLFRQAQPGAWQKLIERVAAELKVFLTTAACDTTESPVGSENLHDQIRQSVGKTRAPVSAKPGPAI